MTVSESKLNIKDFETCSHDPLEHLKPMAISPGEQCSLSDESHIGKISTLQELSLSSSFSLPTRQ